MKRLILVVAALFALAAAPVHAADKPNDAAALKGVKTGKVVWDVSMANPETLALFLSVVRETYDDLARQNVKPEMVLAIHGVPVKFVRANRDDLPLETSTAVDKINDVLDDLAKRPGVRIEVCSIANRLFGVDNASIKPNYHVVGNTWVSLIGYQAQGYAVVPIN
ncbi:MAG: DsrE family protein [Alphaproteobacteria bacterium]|nr:DsrE family protein [Alphaproteobacteria bacterium]